MGKLNLIKMNPEEYHSLLVKDKTAIYWLDDGSIYIGDHLYGGKFSIIEEDPIAPEKNTLYVNLKENTLKIFNGEKLISIQLSTGKLKGTLTIGDKVFDGTSDVIIETYTGEMSEDSDDFLLKLIEDKPKLVLQTTENQMDIVETLFQLDTNNTYQLNIVGDLESNQMNSTPINEIEQYNLI